LTAQPECICKNEGYLPITAQNVVAAVERNDPEQGMDRSAGSLRSFGPDAQTMKKRTICRPTLATEA